MSARDALPDVLDAELRIALLDAADMMSERAAMLRVRADTARAYDAEGAADMAMHAHRRERQAALLRAEFERRVSEAAQAWRDSA